MPAPLAVLLNLSPAVERALAARFTALLPALPPFIQRDRRDLPAQHLTIQFVTAGATGHLHPMPDGSFTDDAWRYTLEIEVCTVRIKDRADTHGYLTGRVREIVQAARLDPAFLRYHVLSTMLESGGAEDIAYSDDSDSSKITYTGIVGIRGSAWPASL